MELCDASLTNEQIATGDAVDTPLPEDPPADSSELHDSNIVASIELAESTSNASIDSTGSETTQEHNGPLRGHTTGPASRMSRMRRRERLYALLLGVLGICCLFAAAVLLLVLLLWTPSADSDSTRNNGTATNSKNSTQSLFL